MLLDWSILVGLVELVAKIPVNGGQDNGKKDCWGQVTKPGKTTTRYVLLNPAQDRFIVCTAEDGRQCFGPFVKVEGGEI